MKNSAKWTDKHQKTEILFRNITHMYNPENFEIKEINNAKLLSRSENNKKQQRKSKNNESAPTGQHDKSSQFCFSLV